MEEVERLCKRIVIVDHGKIMAAGKLDALFTRITLKETISIVRNPRPAAVIISLQGFGTLVEDEDRYTLQPNPGFTFSTFFTSIEHHDIPSSMVHIHEPTLEALFLMLIGRSLRD